MKEVFLEEIILSGGAIETIGRIMKHIGKRGFSPVGGPENIKYFVEGEFLFIKIPSHHKEEGDALHTLSVPSKHWSFVGIEGSMN